MSDYSTEGKMGTGSVVNTEAYGTFPTVILISVGRISR